MNWLKRRLQKWLEIHTLSERVNSAERQIRSIDIQVRSIVRDNESSVPHYLRNDSKLAGDDTWDSPNARWKSRSDVLPPSIEELEKIRKGYERAD